MESVNGITEETPPSNCENKKNEERRKQAMYSAFVPIPVTYSSHSVYYPRYYRYNPLQTSVIIGTLPTDFLRLPSSPITQEEQDRAAAIHLQNEIIAQSRQQHVGRLEITFVNAVLNKNYGLSRMDPYLRLRIGRHIYETHTANNGAKNPQWHKTFQIYHLPGNVNTMYIEIFDERTLTEDELIAWACIEIPESVYKGEVIDEWYKLSGKLGEDAEGVIHIAINYATGPAPLSPPVMMVPGYTSTFSQVPVYTMPPGQPAQNYPVVSPSSLPPPEIKPEDIKQLQEMFPGVEETAIKSILEASNGNKEYAINSLLQMQ